VREGSLAVDLDHRQVLAVARLELRVPADVDELQLELEGQARANLLDDFERPRAQRAVSGVVERDALCYG
jgi:hypothetical protein